MKMYRKTIITLACAVISAPAFAQSPCPAGLGRHLDPPCSPYLRNPAQPVPKPAPPADLTYHGNPNGSNGSPIRPSTGPDYVWDRHFKPPSTSTTLTPPKNIFVGSGISQGMDQGQVGGIKKHF
jgi:hypothetical protein